MGTLPGSSTWALGAVRTSHPLESFPAGRRVSPHRDKVQTTPGLAHENRFVCPALPGQRPPNPTPTISSHPGSRIGGPAQNTAFPPTSTSSPAPPPQVSPSPSLRRVQAPLWDPTSLWTVAQPGVEDGDKPRQWERSSNRSRSKNTAHFLTRFRCLIPL